MATLLLKADTCTADSVLGFIFDGYIFGVVTPDVREVPDNFNSSSGDFEFGKGSFDAWCSLVHDTSLLDITVKTHVSVGVSEYVRASIKSPRRMSNDDVVGGILGLDDDSFRHGHEATSSTLLLRYCYVTAIPTFGP